jgi:flagella synthesis protein FlgN
MHQTALLQLFEEDIAHADRLCELIDAEFDALQTRELERLQTVLAEKQPLLALLDQHARIRSDLLRQAQLSADRTGLEELAARSPEGDRLLKSSHALNEGLDRCREKNLRNGRLINANQAAVGKLLGILRGGNDTPNLYDRRGATARGGYHRPLSEA